MNDIGTFSGLSRRALQIRNNWVLLFGPDLSQNTKKTTVIFSNTPSPYNPNRDQPERYKSLQRRGIQIQVI